MSAVRSTITSSSTSPFFDCMRPTSIEEMLSALNFMVDESEIRPLTPPRSPVEHLSGSNDSECTENDFAKEISRALHSLYEDSVQNNRARYKKAMAHLDDLLCLYNAAQVGGQRRPSMVSL